MGYESRKRTAQTDKPHTLIPVTAVLEQRRREVRSRPDYAHFRMALIGRILAEHLTPIEVARELETAADRFPEIELEECRRYREMRDTWR